MVLEANLSAEEMIQSLIDDLKSRENHYRKIRKSLEEILRSRQIDNLMREAEGDG